MSDFPLIDVSGVYISIGTEMDGSIFRRTLTPGSFVGGAWVPTDLSEEIADIQASAGQAWTPGAVAQYQLELEQSALPQASGAYQISKTTPWLRMTDTEADQVYAQMQLTSPRLRGIYDAATYLSSDDDLWPILHDMIASVLGSTARADEILAPEA